VFDDRSADATLEIVEDFRQQAPFAVHIYRNETDLGYIKNFEKALPLCAGGITFLSIRTISGSATRMA
jgi:glycosyltransferase involved in cell wall biosynthesis